MTMGNILGYMGTPTSNMLDMQSIDCALIKRPQFVTSIGPYCRQCNEFNMGGLYMGTPTSNMLDMQSIDCALIKRPQFVTSIGPYCRQCNEFNMGGLYMGTPTSNMLASFPGRFPKTAWE